MELLDGSKAPEITVAEPALNREEIVVEAEMEVPTPIMPDTDEDSCVDEESEYQPLTKAQLLESMSAITSEADVENLTADDISRFKQQFYSLRNNELHLMREAFIAAGNDPETFSPGIDPDEDVFKIHFSRIRELKARVREQQEAQRLANLERKRAVIAEFAQMAQDTDNINRHHQRAKELQAEFRVIGDVPPQNATDIWKEYQEAVEKFYDQAKINKELYDYDLKKNLGEKELIIGEAVKLTTEEDVILAFRRLQDLHAKWREIGPVAKDMREDVWNRFKDASTIINARYQQYFEERKARERENEESKTALCEQVEAIDFSTLKSYSAWDETTRKIIALQEEWRKLGFASKKANNQLFARFRTTCDNFFAAKADFYKRMKEEFAANMARKIELCERAEALADRTDWRRTTDELVDLQRQWKNIGPVGRKQSDAVWKRFQTACDRFFEQKKKNTSDQRSVEQANLKAKKELVARMRSFDADGLDIEAQQVLAEVKKAQAEWKEIGHVPFRDKDKVYESFREAIDALFARYDMRGQRSRMTHFEENLAEISGDRSKVNRERERLVRVFEQRKTELSTYENNLGFLSSKSSSGNSMVREMERRVQRLKDDIAELAEKIRLIDEKA